MRKILFAAILAAPFLLACPPQTPTGGAKPGAPETVHVYTSMYREVVDVVAPAVDAHLKKTAPGVKVEWVQGGSEKLAKRLETDGDASTADVLLTADPAQYRALKAANKLVAYESPEASRQRPEFKDPDHMWATARFSTMVIGVSPETSVGENGTPPASFRDLADPQKPWKIAIGDPLFSGTNLTTVATLSRRIGWDYYKSLHYKHAVVAGGNSTVLQRLDTATSDVGIVLLENILAARAEGSKVGAIFPKDGAVVIPGPIALLAHAKDSKGARAVYDAILSADVQKVIVEQGYMHSPDPAMPTPAGAP
ncbi:MAG TPA: extracellular solute-binding protein, partial [bacterium]|nr:extracellular solute-binding protein [bacterium]